MNKLKIVYKINYICSEAVLQRCSARKMLCKHEANPQENNIAEAQPQKAALQLYIYIYCQ